MPPRRRRVEARGERARRRLPRRLLDGDARRRAGLGLGDTLGSFAVGKQFDACKIECEAGVYDTFPECIPDGTPRLHIDFEQFLNLGDDRNVAAVFVQGRLVKGAV